MDDQRRSSTTPPTQRPEGSFDGDGMAVLSYILAGILFYGGLGWVGDHYLQTSWLLPTGLIGGLAASFYIIVKRYGGLR